MKRNWKIILLTGIILLVVIFLAVNLYNSGKKELLSQFRENQFIHAQHISIQIESFFLHHLWSLQDLSASVLRQSDDLKKKEASIQDNFHARLGHKEKAYIKSISLHDEVGSIIYSTNKDIIGLNDRQSEYFIWAKKKENWEKVFVWPLFKTPTPRFILAIPLYDGTINREDRLQADGKFAGVLSLTVDLKEFLTDQLGLAVPRTDPHQVWIIDKEGRLLFQSEHQGMVLRNIFQRDESCNQGHISFEYAERILKERHGLVGYKLRNGPEKLAAFAPLEFENISWIVVVNSPFDEVTAFTLKSLQGYTVLLGIVIFALIGGSTLIIRNDRFKVKAEEEVKHWREKQSLEDRIRRSEQLYRTIVETAHDTIWMLDPEGKLTFVNKSTEETSGYQASELMGKSFEVFLHPEDLTKAREGFQRILKGQSYSDEIRVHSKDGKIQRLSVNTIPLYAGGRVIGMASFGRDVTEQKESEAALRESEKQLRHLSSQLLTAQETERQRISRELHDELGQALTLMKIRLRFIENELGGEQAVIREEFQDILQYIDQVIENVRRLSRDLSPSILEDLGLTAALQWLVSNFIKRDAIKVSLEITDIDDLFSQDRQIIIYRILQEALTNIGKHADAKNVSVVTQKHDGRVSLCIKDDGKGFDVARDAMREPSERGLGLAIIDGRARMLGASLDLWSQEGKGTQITLSIPTDKGGSPE
jgi:PAS domain S-box-containing protein